MKFRVERDALADAVAWTAKALPTRPSVPVIAGVMLRVADGQLHVSSFDYEVSSQASIEVQAETDGAALASGRLLAEITRALPAKPVEVAAVGSHLELVCGSARFTLPTMPVEDYPMLPDMPASAGTVEASAFARAVAQVAVVAGRDDTMTLLATDKYRLAVRELTWRPNTPGASLTALIPARMLADTAKTLGPLGSSVTVALSRGGAGTGMIGFMGGTRRTTSRLLDGDFPKVRYLLSDHHASTARIATAALIEVTKRIALVAERTHPIRLSFSEDGLIVEAGGSEDARASEAMDCVYTGEPMRVAFNYTYLLEGLGLMNAPTVLLGVNDPQKPVTLTPVSEDGEIIPGYRYVMMPLRTGS
jgi:DNA polymerase-3 subunit beta